MSESIEKLFSEVGFPIELTCTFDWWQSCLAYAMAGWQNATWRLADALNHPMAETHEGLQAIEDYIKVGRLRELRPQTLLNIKNVGRKFPIETRKPGVPFTCYQEAASLPLTVALEIIDKAQDGEWPAKKVREAVRAVSVSGKVISEEPPDAMTVKVSLRNHCMDFLNVLADSRLGPDQWALAARPLRKALREL